VPTFDSSGVAINYIDEGAGPPVVLVHGFAANLETNWRAPGVVDALLAAGRRVVALDCRGHGKSGKPHDPDAYARNAMALDVIALMDHLGIDRADLAGYSMGSFISARLLVSHPERWKSAILAGGGDRIMSGGPRLNADAMAKAFETSDPSSVTDDIARGFRQFAERSGNDLAALAAMQRAPERHAFDGSRLRDVRIPVLVLIGENDTLVGKGEQLAAAIPGAKLVHTPGDHITAVAKPEFREAMVDFLGEHSAAGS
jgi:pimeloyl-ACP methyl ester carboxylesterase